MSNRNGRERRFAIGPEHIPALIAVIPFMAAVIFCATQIKQEMAAYAMLGQLQGNGSSPLSHATAPISPRQMAYEAEDMARRAAQTQDVQLRKQLISRAFDAVEQAIHMRPAWADAWLIKAHVIAVRDGLDSVATRQAVERSYALAPFMPDAADWRIGYAINQWSALSPELRAAVAREAILLARGSRNLGVHVRILTSGTPLYALIKGRVWPKESADTL